LSDSEQVVPPQRAREKTLLQPSTQKESEPHPSVLAKARLSAEKGQPMGLSLFLNTIVIGNAHVPDISIQTIPLHEANKKTIEKEKADKDVLKRNFAYKPESQVDDLLFKMNQFIRPLNGKILTREYGKQKDRLTMRKSFRPTCSFVLHIGNWLYHLKNLENGMIFLKILFHLAIDPAGQVINVHLDKGVNNAKAFEICMIQNLKKLRYPAAKSGEDTVIQVVFVLSQYRVELISYHDKPVIRDFWGQGLMIPQMTKVSMMS
jgi:hypothetical protein